MEFSSFEPHWFRRSKGTNALRKKGPKCELCFIYDSSDRFIVLAAFRSTYSALVSSSLEAGNRSILDDRGLQLYESGVVVATLGEEVPASDKQVIRGAT